MTTERKSVFTKAAKEIADLPLRMEDVFAALTGSEGRMLPPAESNLVMEKLIGPQGRVLNLG